MDEPLHEPYDGDGANDPPPEDAQGRMARMIDHIQRWTEATYAAIKAEHEARHQEQLALLEPLEGVNMQAVLDALIKLNAIEEVLGTINLTRNSVYQTLREHGLPEKTVRAALKIARATVKRDASQAVLDRCVALALSLMPDEDEEPPAPRRPAPGEGQRYD